MKKQYYRIPGYYDDKWRVRFVLLLLLIVLLVLLGRIVNLTVFDRKFLLNQGNARTLRIIPIPAYRGMILDRNHYPLAISTPVYSVWVNPHQFTLQDAHISALTTILHESKQEIQAHITARNTTNFIYLKRQLPPSVAEKISELNIPGLYLQRNYHRFYPDADIYAPLLGITNVDDKGQEGIELAYNNTLQGIPGQEKVLQDLYGHVVAVEGVVTPAKPGQDLVLSIDHRIQYLAYTALAQAVTNCGAESGSMVVMDVKTGEVLAMVSVPSYNPNVRPKYRNINYKNRAVVDVFEPGSSMKTFAVANALKSGKYKPTTLVDTNPGWMILNGHRVEDEHNLGIIDLTTILQRSSNMGMSRVVLSLPPNSLWQTLHQFGFGLSTQSGFPGEATGVLMHRDKWSDITLASMSFGYGLSVTTLQLAHGYSIIAAQGLDHGVSLIKVTTPTKRRIINSNVANQLIVMLQSVVAKGGTATSAHIEGYKVAGKTGTAWILGPNGYEPDHVNAIFAGMVPASAPRIVAVVVINKPNVTHHQGGDVAAPVFAEVMGRALQDLNIPPDDITKGEAI